MTHEPEPVASADPLVAAAWREHHRVLLDIAYRMLGSVADAEDAVQESFARLVRAPITGIDDVRAWLVTVTSRLCLDQLRSAHARRRIYVGPWLPEPVVEVRDDDLDPADRITLDESVRMALLVVLERMTPGERTAFVLHDVFGLPYEQVGDIVGRSADASRQLASRARRRIRDDDAVARPAADPAEHRRLAAGFAAACATGNLADLVAVLHDDVEGEFDSGGIIPGAPTRPVRGAAVVASILLAGFGGSGAGFVVASVNAEPGILVIVEGRIAAVIALGVHDGRVDHVLGIGNPDKLAHLQHPS